MAVYVFPPVNANVTITGGATEATLLDVEQNTLDTVSELQTLNAVDFATEAKQDSQIVEAQSSNTKLDTLIAKDFATAANQTSANTKLDAANTSLDNIEADIDQLNARLGGSLAPIQYDEVVQTYVGATTRLSTVVYKLATVTVKTLTFSYDGSDRLSGVVAT